MKTKKEPLKLECTNCNDEITTQQKEDNEGYCNECAFECWGEGGPL